MRRRPRARRAALRWDVSEDVDVTLGALFQDAGGRRTRRRQPRRRRPEQIRFEDESLEDKWYQLALTLNASLPFGDLVISASYFDRDFHYEADATDYEFRFTQSEVCYDTDYDGIPDECHAASTISAASRGLPRTTSRPRSRPSRRGCSPRPIRRAAGLGWWVRSTARRRDTEFDSFIRDYADTGSFTTLLSTALLLPR